MKCNIGETDRTIRMVLGAFVILLGIISQSWWGLLGVVLLLTGLFKFCALYKAFGFSTCKKEEVSAEEPIMETESGQEAERQESQPETTQSIEESPAEEPISASSTPFAENSPFSDQDREASEKVPESATAE